MKNKFKYLVGYSLKKKIDTKWFKAVNILLCLLVIFIMNMDQIITFFGGNFDEAEKIYVVDRANYFESFKQIYETLAKEIEDETVEVVLDNQILDNKEEIDDKVVVVIEKDDMEYLKGEIVSYDTVSRTTYELVVSSLNNLKSQVVLTSSGLSPEEIAKFTSPVPILETVLNKDAQDNKTKETISGVVTTIVIIPFFILIVTMVQMLGAEINDEKTSRGMEIIISSVPANMHFLSKVLSSLCFVLLQGALFLGYGFLGVMIRKLFAGAGASGSVGFISETITLLKNAGVFHLLLKGGIVLLILFVVSFIAYACVSATLASMTVNIEDFQQLQSPLMIIMMVGYYVALMAVVFDGSFFIEMMAYIPLFSVMIAPVLFLLGEMSLVSLIGSTVVTCIATFFIYKYGLRIYKVGILNYSSSKLWKKMFKSLKQKN